MTTTYHDNDESISSSNSDSSNECPFNHEIASKLTAAFAKATRIDQEFAVQLLKDHDWNIDQALKATYEAKEHAESMLTIKKNWKEIKDQYLRVFSWNTDTTDSEDVEINDLIELRTQSIIEILLREKPDVIFLQQIGTFSLTLIITCLSEFYDDESIQIDSPNNCNYVSIFTLKSTIKKSRVSIIEYSENWKMIKLEIKYKNLVSIDLFNAFIDEKTSSFCFEQIHRTNSDHLVISAISSQISDDCWQSMPTNLDDLWQKTGEQIETIYTFDPQLNDNITEKTGPQRSDRIFFQTTTKSSFQPVHMELEGIQRIQSANHLYPSSHWAIQGYFQIEN